MSARSDTVPKLMLAEEAPKKKGERGRVQVQNLSVHRVATTEDVMRLIQRAQERRRVGETKMNKHSSRSHCVFTLTVATTRITSEGSSMECSGKLHLVDLAGSECARTAGSDGKSAAGEARERERKNINQSLLTLGRVISTLRDCMTKDVPTDSVRIPYRDSKLTRLLQESLGGRCKTVIVATLSPSVLAVEETFSTLNYAQQAHGIQNKPVATSYLKVGTSFKVDGTAAGGDGTTLQDWHEMECRLAYMQAQKEEAQAQLARKHLEQEQLERRANTAEAARAQAQAQLADKENECEQLTSELAIKEHELQVTGFLLASRAATETKLNKQAHRLLSSLNSTEGEASDLHIALSSAAAAIDAQTARRRQYHARLTASLKSAQEGVASLASASDGERAAALRAAAEAEATVAKHAAALGAHAAAMVDASAAEAQRAGTAHEGERAEATAALQAMREEMAASIEASKAQAAASQVEVAKAVDGAVATIRQAQADLSMAVETTVGRQAATEEEAREAREALTGAVEAGAAAAAKRLVTERERFAAHADALRAMLREIRAAREIEGQARAALAELRTTEATNGEAAAARMTAIVQAISAASAAQLDAQQDGEVLDALSKATSALTAAHADANATLEAQRATLAAALEAQRAGNAAEATAAALGEARDAVSASATARAAEAEAAVGALAEQQEGLRALVADQARMRDELMRDVMASVEAKLSEKLDALAASTRSGVDLAVSRSEHVAGATDATAKAVLQTSVAHAASTDAMLKVTGDWGASNDAVGAQIEASAQSSSEATAKIVAGGKAAGAAADGVSALARAWAGTDGACRTALASAISMQHEAIAEAGSSTAAQAAAIAAVDGLQARLVEMADAADEEVSKGIDEVGGGCAGLTGAAEEAEALAAATVGAIGALGDASEAARKGESDALAALNTAAGASTDASTAALGTAVERTVAAQRSLDASVTALGAAADSAIGARLAAWEAHTTSEAEARAAAGTAMAALAAKATAAGGGHAEALDGARTAREQAAADGEAAQRSLINDQTAKIGEMAEATAAFGAESPDDRPPVPERTPQPFTEPFAKTADDDALRSHYEAHGPVPLEHSEPLPSPAPVRRSLSNATAVGSARKSHTPRASLTPKDVNVLAAVSAPTEPSKEGLLAKPADAQSPPAVERRPSGLPAKRLSAAEAKALRDELTKLKLEELRKLADVYESPREGTKADLISRLVKLNAQPQRLEKPPPRSTPRRQASMTRTSSAEGVAAM